MNFIKKIVDGKVDGSVHLQFQKFSKGEFRDRAIIEAKKQGKGKYNIKTSAEFANELVRMVAEEVGSEKVKVKGAIVSTSDLTGELEFKDKKQFQGVKRYLIDNEMSGDQIVGLLDKLPKTFFALTFNSNDSQLKIKPKAPKSGKPAKESEDGPKADFCALKTTNAKIAESFIFEKPDFTEAKVNHTFFIEKIIMPGGETDFAKIRELAKRSGRIMRKSIIDSQESLKEIEFTA